MLKLQVLFPLYPFVGRLGKCSQFNATCEHLLNQCSKSILLGSTYLLNRGKIVPSLFSKNISNSSVCSLGSNNPLPLQLTQWAQSLHRDEPGHTFSLIHSRRAKVIMSRF